MQRKLVAEPRDNWVEALEKLGFFFHTEPGRWDEETQMLLPPRPYWRDNAYYQFDRWQILELERSTNELNQMVWAAVQHVIMQGRFAEFGIPEPMWKLIRDSWGPCSHQMDTDTSAGTLYGRYDFAWNGAEGTRPKMLEANFDTPTSLVEAAIIQWHWAADHFGEAGFDQFNSIQEALIAQWRYLRERYNVRPKSRLHLATVWTDRDGATIQEDVSTIAYLGECARDAGWEPKLMDIRNLQWDKAAHCFVDGDSPTREPVRNLFKLYPWEWMFHEPNARFLDQLGVRGQATNIFEPIWKALVSNKQILVILWELFPEHPLLLPAFNSVDYFDSHGVAYARKPKLSREGANVSLVDPSKDLVLEETGGEYGEEGFVWQQLYDLPAFEAPDGVWHPVLGSWVVGDTSCGMGIRETRGLVTGNMANFVPHIF